MAARLLCQCSGLKDVGQAAIGPHHRLRCLSAHRLRGVGQVGPGRLLLLRPAGHMGRPAGPQGCQEGWAEQAQQWPQAPHHGLTRKLRARGHGPRPTRSDVPQATGPTSTSFQEPPKRCKAFLCHAAKRRRLGRVSELHLFTPQPAAVHPQNRIKKRSATS